MKEEHSGSPVPFGIALFATLSSERLTDDAAKLLYENLWDLYSRPEPIASPSPTPKAKYD